MRSFLLLFLCCPWWAASQAIPVQVAKNGDYWQLLRGGQPYYVNGAGGDANTARLVEAGGNSIRTWGVDESTGALLDAAHARGLTVTLGLWVAYENYGVNYNDPAFIRSQTESFRRWVQQYKDHPAVLAWGIGNEVELGGSNPNVWNAIDDIAQMIDREDGRHPTLTVTAGIDINKARLIQSRCPNLDLLGVNAYGSVGNVAAVMRASGWDIPYLITEWGPNGQWEVPKTTWGAPIEQSSLEKANVYRDRYVTAIRRDTARCLGSYVFLWGGKFEQTPTWFGMFVNGTEATPTVETMQWCWTGAYPANRAPMLQKATIEDKTAAQSVIVTRDSNLQVIVEAIDPDGDPLTYEYVVQRENGTNGHVQLPGMTIPGLPRAVQSVRGNTALLRALENNQNYRLYIFVRDGRNHIATINIPFRAELPPLVSPSKDTLYTTRDAYVRNGEYAGIRYGVTDPMRLQTRFRNAANDGFTREAFVEFDVSTVNQGFDRAVLSVYGRGDAGVQVAVQGFTDSLWSEANISWAFRPVSVPANTLARLTIPDREWRYYDWDVTQWLRQMRAKSKNTVGFVLRNTTESDNPVDWNARELRQNPARLSFKFNNGPILPPQSTDELSIRTIGPNPTAGALTLFYPELFQDQALRWRLYDPLGRLLHDATQTLPAFSAQTTLTLPEAPAGFYWLYTEFGGQRKTWRLERQ